MPHSEMTLFPGQPMRIYSVPDSITAHPEKWCVQIKKNGHRAVVRCDETGTVKMIGRHGDDHELTASKRHEWQWLTDVLKPPFVLDGELVGPRQAGTKNYVLWMFDIILLKGKSFERRPYLDRLYTLWAANPGNVHVHGTHYSYEACSEKLRNVPGYPISWASDLFRNILNPDGENEGLVFKRTDIPLAWHTRPGVEDPNQLKLRMEKGGESFEPDGEVPSDPAR